jgi:hypothetical protein
MRERINNLYRSSDHRPLSSRDARYNARAVQRRFESAAARMDGLPREIQTEIIGHATCPRLVEEAGCTADDHAQLVRNLLAFCRNDARGHARTYSSQCIAKTDSILRQDDARIFNGGNKYVGAWFLGDLGVIGWPNTKVGTLYIRREAWGGLTVLHAHWLYSDMASVTYVQYSFTKSGRLRCYCDHRWAPLTFETTFVPGATPNFDTFLHRAFPNFASRRLKKGGWNSFEPIFAQMRMLSALVSGNVPSAFKERWPLDIRTLSNNEVVIGLNADRERLRHLDPAPSFMHDPD